jgi:hypothetical protein
VAEDLSGVRGSGVLGNASPRSGRSLTLTVPGAEKQFLESLQPSAHFARREPLRSFAAKPIEIRTTQEKLKADGLPT